MHFALFVVSLLRQEQKKNTFFSMCDVYKAYFGIRVGDQDKTWTPHFTCEYCKKTLESKIGNYT